MKELIEKIINKEFESVINGYSPISVDVFLVLVINDIKKIQSQINEVKIQNEELKNKIKMLEEANALLAINKSNNDENKSNEKNVDDNLNELKKD